MKDFIDKLTDNNQLIRIKGFVDPELEITEITDRISKSGEGGKALLFENTGKDFPVLINALGSYKRLCLAFNTDELDKIGFEIEKIFRQLTNARGNLWKKLRLLPLLKTVNSWMPKIISGKGECQQVIREIPDLNKLPVLKCWPEDGGKFITMPMVITRDLENNARNVGMYRMQILDNNSTGMHWHPHKTGARHYEQYKTRGKKMPVAVALGGDPVLSYSATAPLPDNIDEFMLAGFLRKKKIKLVKCITNDLEVPAEADIVIEGYIDPAEELILEGPFGDHTGFYSLPDWFPKFHVTAITHKNNAVYPATIVGIPPQEDAWLIKATERIFLKPMKLTQLPEILDMDMPPQGVAHNLTIFKINNTFKGQAQKVMNTIWGAGQMMFNKIMIITGRDVDIHNYKELTRKVLENIDLKHDLYFSRGPLDILDHSSDQFAYGSKLCIDATDNDAPPKHYKEFINNDIIDGIVDLVEKTDCFSNVNISLLKKNIPVLFISVKITGKDLLINAGKNFLNKISLPGLKVLIMVDHGVDINDISVLTWVTLGNIDPQRDIHLINNEHELPCLVVNATGKYSEKYFERDWPNVIVSDNKTINKIDNKWEKLELGDFIQSPSLKFKNMILSEGASVKRVKE